MCTTDIISSFTQDAYSFVSFELGLFYAWKYFLLENRINYLGYFIFDSIDMLRNSSGRQTYEILLHHITVNQQKNDFIWL